MSRPELDELEELVRDAAPRPSAEFILELDERVAQRFPRPAKRRWWHAVPLRPALATACALVIAVPVGVVALDGGGDDFEGGGGGSVALEQAAPPAAAEDAASGGG